MAARQKGRVDSLFTAHAVVSISAAVVSLLIPNLFEWMLIHRGEPFRLRDNSRPESKVVHLVIRMYGALILAQGLVVWNARRVADAAMRKSMITAYALCFSLTTLALLRAQLTESTGGEHPMNGWNWLTILVMGGLSTFYANFLLFDKVRVFEGLDKALS